MSKFLEIISLLPKALENPMAVLEGWRNSIKMENSTSGKPELAEDEIEEILRRRAICHSCPFNSINATTSSEYKELFKEPFTTDRTDLHCSLCSCNINYKSASLSSDCGIEKYNFKYPNNKLPLKWEAYKKTNG